MKDIYNFSAYSITQKTKYSDKILTKDLNAANVPGRQKAVAIYAEVMFSSGSLSPRLMIPVITDSSWAEMFSSCLFAQYGMWPQKYM